MKPKNTILASWCVYSDLFVSISASPPATSLPDTFVNSANASSPGIHQAEIRGFIPPTWPLQIPIEPLIVDTETEREREKERATDMGKKLVWQMMAAQIDFQLYPDGPGWLYVLGCHRGIVCYQTAQCILVYRDTRQHNVTYSISKQSGIKIAIGNMHLVPLPHIETGKTIKTERIILYMHQKTK